MEGCEQVQKGPFKLKGFAELGMMKQKKKDKDKAMGTSIKNKEERQCESLLKKASHTHGQRAEGSADTCTHSQALGRVQGQLRRAASLPGTCRGSRRRRWSYVWCLCYFLFFSFFWPFLGLLPQHTEVPRLGAESEL
uniref:Uncharacterized protein n=1 Tax=Sus scrofa TaxID=9823 RepID=A0A8W4F8U5_PIG